MHYFEITPTITTNLGVFPGDQPFERTISLSTELGHHVTLSTIKTTLHLGAHADSSSHYNVKGLGIDRRSLDFYCGDCQVMTLSVRRGERIGIEHIKLLKVAAPRVLLKTGTFPDPENWNSDFAALSIAAVEWFSERGVKLLGIDTPSVDLEDCKKLEAHQAIFNWDMAILEGLVLKHVPDAIYTLLCLPLRIKDGDASPVRAILLEKAGLLTTGLTEII